MKNITFTFTGIFAFLFLFSACDDDTVAIFDTESVVVQSYLYANNAVDSFRVTQAIGSTETSDDIVTFDDLSITINDGSADYVLNPIGAGYYQNMDLVIENGKTYEMDFEHDGMAISSTTYVPENKEVAISQSEIYVEKVYAGVMMPPTQTDPITVSWDNTEGDYYYVVVQNIEETPEYIDENLATAQFTRPRIITEPLVISDYNVDTRRDIQFFGTYQIVVYRVNPEYAALYATAENTSTSLVEPSSNIDNGLGIMTGISTDTVFFEVNEL